MITTRNTSKSQRLSSIALAQLSPGVQCPAYDRAALTPGIVHLGVGAFHRAHQAVYMDDLLGMNPDWAIAGASLRRPDTRDALAPQDFLYCVAVRDASGTSCRIIGSIIDIVDASSARTRLLELMVAPTTRIVSLTVTEKGYCHDPATGELDERHPDILHDLAHPHAPRSAPGLIVEALRLRRDQGHSPFSVMSCDNLPANGKTAGRIVTALARLRDPELGAFVAQHVAFPSSMVDRIVPATTDEDRAEISSMLGVQDAWPIVTEAFSQWVIEDNFPAGRPPFEQAGAQMVADVEPFEHMKLRMLNGAHSSLAYLGYLAGFKTVSEVVDNPEMRKFLYDLMSEEIIPTLDLPGTDLSGTGLPGADLPAYRDALLARFANPSLRHATWQIAMDGSQKLPQRLLDTIRDRIMAGKDYRRLLLGVAGWIIYVSGRDERGKTIDVRDPLVQKFQEIVKSAGDDTHVLVEGFLGLRGVFGADLPRNEIFREKLVDTLALLRRTGVIGAVRAFPG